jgi:hypothetical protein
VAHENGALRAWLNPKRQWTFDRLDVWEAGDDKTFGPITGTWVGAVDAPTMMQTAVQDSYEPGYIHRNQTFTFNGGSEVYVLDAPDGEAFVMQSFTRHWDPGLTEDNLAHLGGRLDLPDGWGFRIEVLDRDMESRPWATRTSLTWFRTTCTTSTRARMEAGHSATYAGKIHSGRHRDPGHGLRAHHHPGGRYEHTTHTCERPRVSRILGHAGRPGDDPVVDRGP